MLERLLLTEFDTNECVKGGFFNFAIEYNSGIKTALNSACDSF
jgi:hypothetical protein